MRVIAAVLGRVIHREDGAVLAIAAISLIVLLGMLVLTVDLGRSVAIKRQIVNGTDAAALAAAQDCAENRSDVARSDAAAILDDNRGGATITGFDAPQCDHVAHAGIKTVTVRSSTDVNYFFAPIFGVNSGAVTATATAVWGPTTKARPIPITANLDQLQACHIPDTALPEGQAIDCELDYPKDTLQEPRWGGLDLSRWNDPSAAPCHVDANELMNEIASGGWPTSLPLNTTPTIQGKGFGYTPDCLDNGLSFSVWMSMEGKTLTFPVMDVATSTCNGSFAGDQPNCEIDTANIVSFVTLKVVSAVNDGSTVRLQVQWLGPTTSEGDPGTGPDFGNDVIRLVK